MARAPRPKADADFDAYAHETARRRNIPTAENQGLVPDAAPGMRDNGVCRSPNSFR